MKVLTVPSAGSAGGLTWQRSRAGTVVRSRRKPVTARGGGRFNTFRDPLARVARSWRLLTDAQRRAWAMAAPNAEARDALGQVFFLSGYWFYMRVNLRRLRFGVGVLTVPVTTAAVVPSLTIGLTVTSGSPGVMNLVTSGQSSSRTFAVFVGAPQSTGSTYPRALRWVANVFHTAPGGTTSVLSAWTSRFGNVPVGSRVFWEVRVGAGEALMWPGAKGFTDAG